MDTTRAVNVRIITLGSRRGKCVCHWVSPKTQITGSSKNIGDPYYGSQHETSSIDRKLFWDMLWQRVSTSTERKYIAYKLLWWYRLIETNWSPTAVLLHWEESSDKWWPAAACHVRWPWPAPSWQRWEGVTKGGSVRRLNEFNIVLKRALGIFTSFQFSLDFDQLQPKSSLDLSGNTTEQISI